MKIMEHKTSKITIDIVSLIIAILIGGALILLAPIFVMNEYIDQKNLALTGALIHVVTSGLMTFAWSRFWNGGVIVTLMGSAAWFLLVFIFGMLVFRSSSMNVLLMGTACLCGGIGETAISYMITNRNRKAKRRRKRN